ncbi:MAG: tetratricopeptide repeat protein [Bryobacteraceae bacterium]
MKAKKRPSSKTAVPAASSSFRWGWAAAAAALCAVFWAYGPALRGPFLFDDADLPFALPNFSPSLKAWLAGTRKLLMFSYWVNARIGHDDPYSYHVLGVLIHAVAAALVFLIVRRLLEWSKSEPASRNLLAGFAAAVFLLHPAQTEAVAYIAGRSEALSAMFFFAAFTVFLYRRQPPVRWGETAAVLLLFMAALLSKEPPIVLPVVLLLTDYWWNPGFTFSGIRGNWKLYVPVMVGALAGLAIIWKGVLTAETAGFQLKDFTWYQYFFTQCRGLFVYPGIFLFPANLNADWDFPISRTLFDHGAIFGLAALVALAAVAWLYRRRFPLASYGFFLYLLLMAPTSSIMPIQDAIAERRLYFSMIGLLLIVVDFLGRLKVERRGLAFACAAVVLVAAMATYARAAVWADPIRLWEDTVRQSPRKFRAHFQLGYAYYDRQRYGAAVEEYQKAGDLPARDLRERNNLLVDWALALDGLGRPADAIAKLREAAATEPTAHVYSQIGMIYAKQSEWAPALDALDQAQKLDAGYAMTYVYRGKIYELMKDPAAAIQQFQRALELDPADDQVRQELLRLRSLPPGGRGR